MGAWREKIADILHPPKPFFTLSEDGLTFTQITRYWPPWNRTYSRTTFFWKDIATVTVRKWDLYIVDTIGMVFEHRDGRTLTMTEDHWQGTKFYTLMERVLPKALPGILDPDDWYTGVHSVPPFHDCPTVIYSYRNFSDSR